MNSKKTSGQTDGQTGRQTDRQTQIQRNLPATTVGPAEPHISYTGTQVCRSHQQWLKPCKECKGARVRVQEKEYQNKYSNELNIRTNNFELANERQLLRQKYLLT